MALGKGGGANQESIRAVNVARFGRRAKSRGGNHRSRCSSQPKTAPHDGRHILQPGARLCATFHSSFTRTRSGSLPHPPHPLSLPRRPPCPSPSSTTSPSLSRRPPTTRSSRSRSLDRSGLASLVSAPAPVAERSVDRCMRLAKPPTAIVSTRLLSWLRRPHERVSRSPISPRDS